MELLGNAEKNNKNIIACLLIMNQNLGDELSESLLRLNKLFDISINDIENLQQKNLNDKIMIIHSDSSGVGKSTFIRNKASKEN